MIKVGVIGYGYWGPNLARNFHHNPESELSAICDASPDRLEAAAKLYPDADLTRTPEEILDSTDVDAIAIATPVSTHFELAKKAISSGKHVWLEKPMTERTEQAEALIELAGARNKILFVDHTFVYTGAVMKIKELVDKGELGDLIYYDSVRVNLGLFQQDVDVVWDLAPHDISIMDHLMPFKKTAVSATGCNYYGNGLMPKASLTIYMENNVLGHLNVSWVAPVKIRQTLIGGTSKMILYDDTQPSEKVKVYDKGVELYDSKEDLYHLKVLYRVGDMYAPNLRDHEALAVAADHFLESVNSGSQPMTDGRAGLEVVKVLVACQESMKGNGAPVEI